MDYFGVVILFQTAFVLNQLSKQLGVIFDKTYSSSWKKYK